MSLKMKQILGIYICAALVTLSVCAAVWYDRLEDYRLFARYSSHQAFETTVKAVDDMSQALRKSLYATDGGLCAAICGEVYADALAAEAAMASMPFATHELEQLSAFINQTGDYASSLTVTAAEQGFSRQEQENLQAMSEKAREFTEQLRQLQTQLNSGELLLDGREERLENVGVKKLDKVSDALLEYEAGFGDLEPLSYDGKYSHREEASGGDLEEQDMLQLAALAAGVEPRELKEEYFYEGSDGRRCYSAGGLSICVSSLGLESMGQSRLVSEGSISADEARQTAEQFLQKLELEPMALISYSDTGTLASFDFAQVQEDAIRLDSGVRITVALDDGSIYSFSGKNYERQASQVSWNCTEDEARETLPENITVESERKVIIKSAGGSDKPCYEYSCLNEAGEGLRIYVDADSGRQCRIDI